jgi:hypothetical protein
MKALLAIALGLMLLVSGAIATGNGNIGTVNINTYVSANCLTEASFAQIGDVNGNFIGNSLQGAQTMAFVGTDNVITGFNPDETFALQKGIMDLTDSGCSNIDTQAETFLVAENCLTVGNINQILCQSADIFGDDNKMTQNSVGASFENTLTGSEIGQISGLSAGIGGSSNNMLQSDTLTAAQNCMAGSSITEVASINADISGCGNLDTGELNSAQVAIETAALNKMTNGLGQQSVGLDVQSIGSENLLAQFGTEGLFTNCVVDGMVIQNIDAEALSTGCFNEISHVIDAENFESCITGGIVLQDVSVSTNM